MDALWSAATIKLIGSGIDDADFAGKLSRLTGEHEVPTVTKSTNGTGGLGIGGISTSIAQRQEPILPTDAIRALPKGTALLLATGIRPTVVHLKPWYQQNDAASLAAASARATAAITQRARAKSTAEDEAGPTTSEPPSVET